jgi:tryptophan halogenase
MTDPLRSVAVFGGGVVALAAATAFAQALPGASVTLVARPVDAAAFADRLPVVWPSSAAMLDRLGIDQAALIDHGAAIPRLALRFADWSRDSRTWLVAEGEPIRVAGPGQLHQRWLDAAHAGSPLPFHALFPAAAIAEGGRDGLPDGADAALRLDPATVTDILVERLRRRRARLMRGMIAAVEREGDRIAAVRLDDGARLAADLFVDATGPVAALAWDDDRIDWCDALPCDRLLVAPHRDTTPVALDDHRAIEIGWSARWPRPGGDLRSLAYASTVTSDERARRALASGRDTAVLVTCRPGRRRYGWTGNMLALGEAAAQPGPLAHAGLTLALAHLALALDLLPGRTMEPLLIAEYNRRAALRADRLRDYLAAFYLAGPRRRGGFWRAMATREPPPGLAATLAQYTRRGLLPHHEEESVSADAWHAVLLGQGIRPERRDPVAMAVDPAAHRAALAAAAETLRVAAGRLPPGDPRA